MLVARVCQLYPQATGSVIVGKFFRIMNKWAWPQPVLLKPIEDGPLQMKVWNPKVRESYLATMQNELLTSQRSIMETGSTSCPSSLQHILPCVPLITFPCQQRQSSCASFSEGGDIVDKIFLKQLTWNDLFARHTFFSQDYKYYLCITSSSKTKEAQAVWSGLVESKLRHLVGALDRKPAVSVAHPFPKGFERVHVVRDDKEAEAVKNGSTQYQAQGTKTETTDETKDPSHTAAAETGAENAQVPGSEPNGNSDSRTIYTTTYYIGLELKPLEPGRDIDICRLISLTGVGSSRSLDVSADAQIFKSTCTSWQGYQPGINDLTITHVRK